MNNTIDIAQPSSSATVNPANDKTVTFSQSDGNSNEDNLQPIRFLDLPEKAHIVYNEEDILFYIFLSENMTMKIKDFTTYCMSCVDIDYIAVPNIIISYCANYYVVSVFSQIIHIF